MKLGTIGIWSLAFTHGDRGEAKEAAAELEDLGYGTLWLGGDPGGNPSGDLATAADVLDATDRVTVATGCVSIWDRPATRLAAAYHALPEHQRARLLVGLGVSHAECVDRYRRPYAALAGFLDELDAASPPLPASARIVGAHGPMMTRLGAARSVGVHPYLVDVTHTARARSELGTASLLATQQTVILTTAPATARSRARTMLAPYLRLANYREAWLRIGFDSGDLADGGSDRLVDALFACGTPDEIAARITEHTKAGADHIALQVVTADRSHFARAAWRELAAALC
ncbi:putative F420-dependent oxidoreductase [Streptomyces sp. 840.1]|uniref:TIGR03620 family F420-dependent LLM class oxidoreductase n=1 Tax=Streptomyces sp. 840.1 TaxID=2485152 RepID=UPI000F4858E9|nr:TIGR03620 family F420-dependent LLM class oxidoreductase [Streptomyces sp. 840.1]ROQ67315.1 putative F420-dependent oxidoreductase [Streptomyces sp. 840.1]